MLFSVYALFLFVLTTFVAAVPAGSRSRGNEATSVVTISLETEAAYVCDHGGIWTRQGSRSVSRLFCRMVHLSLTHLTARSGRYKSFDLRPYLLHMLRNSARSPSNSQTSIFLPS